MELSQIYAIISLYFSIAFAQNLELLLLHTNDMHSKFEEITPVASTCHMVEKNKTCVGGFARLAHEIRRYRKWGENNTRKVLFLNAGDTFVGSEWYSVIGWKICAEMLNALQPDVITLGNHEFDDGLQVLNAFTNSLNCPIVSANFDVTKVDSVKKSTVLEIDGRKIGIIGYITQETAFLIDTDKLNISDEIAAVKAESEKLDQEGVKIIFGLGHSGYNIDRKLAEEVPLLDLVIGGHTNTFLWNGPKPHEEDIQGPYPTVVKQKSGKKVPVVQAYAFTLYLGRLNVTFDGNGDLIDFSGQPEYISADIPEDRDILDILDKYRGEIIAVNQQIVGRSSVYLDGMCRLQECNFGNLITDAMVYYSAFNNRMNTESWANASVALYNAGNLRNSINVTYSQGNISKGELMAAVPFKNDVVSVILKGSVILEALEHSVENYENNFINAQFLQVSGLRIVYDMSKEGGHRVKSVKVRCSNCTIPTYQPLEMDSNYNVMMTDFVLNGGDGYIMIKENAKNVVNFELSIYELMEWYFNLQSPVYPEVQGRIKFINIPNAAHYISPSLWMCSWLIVICFLLMNKNH